jgi:hypothetical protein
VAPGCGRSITSFFMLRKADGCARAPVHRKQPLTDTERDLALYKNTELQEGRYSSMKSLLIAGTRSEYQLLHARRLAATATRHGSPLGITVAGHRGKKGSRWAGSGVVHESVIGNHEAQETLSAQR